LHDTSRKMHQLVTSKSESEIPSLLKQFAMQAKSALEKFEAEFEAEQATKHFELPERVESSLPMDDPELREIVEDFIPHLGQKIGEMDAQTKSKLFDELADNAHWLKGAGGTVGFNDFYQPACELEKAAKAKNEANIELHLDHIRRLNDRIYLPSLQAT